MELHSWLMFFHILGAMMEGLAAPPTVRPSSRIGTAV